MLLIYLRTKFLLRILKKSVVFVLGLGGKLAWVESYLH